MTVSDLADSGRTLRHELINGNLYPLTLSGLHQIICRKLADALEPERHDWANFLPLCNMSLEVDRHNAPRADVVIAPLRHFGRTTIPARHLLLVAEVLSPDSQDRDRGEKADLYAHAGVPAYWLIDPDAAQVTLTAHRLNASGYQTVFQGDRLFQADWPWPATIDLRAMTTGRNRIRDSGRH